MTSRPDRSGGVIAALLGSAAAILIVLAIVLVTRGDDEPPTTTQAAAPSSAAATTTGGTFEGTTAAAAATSTTAANATSIAQPTTPTGGGATTTTTSTTTTVPAFAGDTDPESGSMSGSPDPRLIDVRWARREGFTRVVFDFGGDSGTPMYQAGYSPGPFVDIAGEPVAVDGSAYLYVVAFPGMRYDLSDPEDIVRTYNGPERIPVAEASVVEIAFVEDFEANMEWVIGTTAEKPFHAFTLEDPTRLVVDVGD